jgi:hypothetical protein
LRQLRGPGLFESKKKAPASNGAFSYAITQALPTRKLSGIWQDRGRDLDQLNIAAQGSSVESGSVNPPRT